MSQYQSSFSLDKVQLTDGGDDERNQTVVDEHAVTDFQHLRDVLVIDPDGRGVSLLAESLVGRQLEALTLHEFNLGGSTLHRQNKRNQFF